MKKVKRETYVFRVEITSDDLGESSQGNKLEDEVECDWIKDALLDALGFLGKTEVNVSIIEKKHASATE